MMNKLLMYSGIASTLSLLAYGALNTASSTASMKVYGESNNRLVVYSDVPGHSVPLPIDPDPEDGAPLVVRNPLAKSPIFRIRVKSAATDNVWVDCFPNHTWNRASHTGNEATHTGNEASLHKIENDQFAEGTRTNPLVTQGYQDHTRGWSHTYANIEMESNATVEVEISKIGTTLLNGQPTIVKSAVHPAHKVFDQKTLNGKVYFKINTHCQVVIDINGQMDDKNAALRSPEERIDVHAVSFFSNPILTKPANSGTGIRYVTAGNSPPTDSNFTTMVFGPGIHRIGSAFGILAGKKYYIPGDAILYGGLSGSGNDIKIYGYGTLNGFFTPHDEFKINNPEYPYPDPDPEDPNSIGWPADGHGVSVKSFERLEVNGITIADSAKFNTYLLPKSASTNDSSKVIWTKAISWRTNGDGISGALLVQDCFLRTADDATAVGAVGDRRRLTIWKDSNANMIRFKNMPPGTNRMVEDCDILYHRLRGPEGTNGGVFLMQSSNTTPEAVPVNVTVRNIRFHDRHPNMPIFKLLSTTVESYKSLSGLKFENLSCYAYDNARIKNRVLGTTGAPWGIAFNNVTFKTSAQDPYAGGTLLTAANVATYMHETSNATFTYRGLPSPWVHVGVGDVGAIGSASVSSIGTINKWTITGSGADIWGASDEFHYVNQSAMDDCSIQADVKSMSKTDSWARAGVMIRESTAANAKYAAVFVTPDNGLSFQYRTANGGTTVRSSITGLTAPILLKLTRVGNAFTAFYSINGGGWTQVATPKTISMSATATQGVAVCSRNDGVLCLSTMEGVAATN